ncbi:MAG: hypothetical protein ABS76_30980 [Pelagibacterium sp. SCN 64-44]|nr:MAG: hypothetical protein ABS76_30980 [Pelagibacterium sp. SCN 64-44]
MIRFAVIADPHVHDCAWAPSGSGLHQAVRSLAETGKSTRVFNESIPAFKAALDVAVEAGARLVLLVGDLTDDGQRPNIAAALAIIADYRARYGLRVLATPGNHDFFALFGRPQSKTFLADGGEGVVVDSRTCPEAATLGTGEGLGLLSGLGFTPDPTDLYWESPFGVDPDWDARTYPVSSPGGKAACRMIDASYLVEPVAGLWVLSLDVNVCVPRDGWSDPANPEQFYDPSKVGWDAVLRHRAHLLPWLADVTRRAQTQGKELVAFSHYPPLDVLGGSTGTEIPVFGKTGLAARMPRPAIAEALARAGLSLHFSGHLHVNDTARYQSAAGAFFNIAVPSPVGYGAAIKIVDLDAGAIHIRTMPLREAEGYDGAFALYRREAAAQGKLPPPIAMAQDHGQFLDHHLRSLVQHRYLAHEWPQDMAAFVASSSMADLIDLLGIDVERAADFPLVSFVEDWYRLRKAGRLALADISAERFALYRELCSRPRPAGLEGIAAGMAVVVELLAIYMNRLPNGDFNILPSREVAALS